jgi:hypothetical protein
MTRKTKAELPAAPRQADELVTVPRVALQALAEWAYPVFGWDRIWSKLPAKHPRWTSWNIHDDLHTELERERAAFLKEVFWKAHREACERERAADPARGYGGSPSLELFMECLAGMEDSQWDEPLALKEVARRKKGIRTKKAEQAKLKDALAHTSVESTLIFITMAAGISISTIKENLASDHPEIKAKAKEELSRVQTELGKLAHAS